MGIGNIFVIVFFTYYTVFFIRIGFQKRYRKSVQYRNQVMDALREKRIKTLDEQKQFLNVKYPKRVGKFKFSWKMVPPIIGYILLFIAIFQGYNILMGYVGIEIKIWQAVLFIVVSPVLINLISRKFNLQKTDLRVFFK